MSALTLLRRQVVFRVITGTVLATLVGLSLLSIWRARTNASQCQDNLSRMYSALLEYERQFGNLPRLAFYPDDASLDPDSLYTALAPFGIQLTQCVCPASPNVIHEAGIGYLWNPALSGTPLRDLSQPVWMLVEIHALSPAVHPPHRNQYHVLYSDGRVLPTPDPPPFR